LKLFLLGASQTITWIKVEKPSLDLVGLVLGSLTLAAALAIFALVVGLLLGVTLIRRTSSSSDDPWRHPIQLDLRH